MYTILSRDGAHVSDWSFLLESRLTTSPTHENFQHFMRHGIVECDSVIQIVHEFESSKRTGNAARKDARKRQPAQIPVHSTTFMQISTDGRQIPNVNQLGLAAETTDNMFQIHSTVRPKIPSRK